MIERYVLGDLKIEIKKTIILILDKYVEYGFHWCQRSSLMTKEMTWHVWWCDMCDEVSKSYDDVLVLPWSHFYNLTPFYKNMATCWNSCWNYEKWVSIGKIRDH